MNKKYKNLFLSLLLVMGILFQIPMPIMAKNGTMGKVVSTVAELKEAVESASGGDIIVLSSEFAFGDIEIKIPNVKVIIDGNNLVWNEGTTTVNGSGTGSLTFKNLKYDGSSINKKIIKLKNESGTVNFENVEFTGSKSGAMGIKTGGKAKTELNRTWFHNNTAKNTAPAIWLGENANLDISNSTFEDNTGSGGGYEAAVISSNNYRGNLNISNSVFRNNVNETVNTGVTGGGGGAMALHYFYGKVIIKDSIFDGNKTSGSEGNVKNTYDGGAIYILDGRDGATFDIEGSTFINNIAYDDGGAIMFQGTGNPGLTTTISNSTFFNNVAYGLDGANYSGGAIQYFKNGGSAKMTNTVLSSTFVGNQAGGSASTTEQRGGAIGLSGAGIFAMAAVTRNDSLFIDNKVFGANGEINTASNYKDISNYTTTQAGTLNVINIQKETGPVYSNRDVLGVSTPKLAVNDSDVKAGFNPEPVMTIMIRPDGIAENTYSGTKGLPSADQRTFERYKDHGAIEISSILYNANGGEFNLPELGENDYDGKFYYEKNIDDKITEYYAVGNIAGETVVLDGLENLNIKKEATNEDENNVFLGWSTNKDVTEPDKDYVKDSEIKYTEETVTLYAIWGEASKYKVTYDGNGNDAGTVPEDSNSPYYVNSVVTVLDEGNLIKENYTFTGWNTAADGSGTAYEAGKTFTITEDIKLYAQWSENSKHTVMYNGNGNSSGDVPEDSNSPYYVNSNVTVLGEGNLRKDNNTFIGWNTAADGSGNSYVGGDTFTITDNVTLYAQWSENAKHTVIYDGNNNTSGDVPEDSNSPYYVNSNVTVLGEGNLLKDNYIFGGWSDESGNVYSAGATFTITKNTILKAVWNIPVPNTVLRVTYDGNGHTGGVVPNDVSRYFEGDTVVVMSSSIERAGYEFVAWNTKADGSGTPYGAGDSFELFGDTILYAQWKKVEAEVEDDKPVNYDSIIWDWSPNTPSVDIHGEHHNAYMNGYPNGSIMPEGEITRGEVAAIIARLHADVEEIQYDTKVIYRDIKSSDWYAKHIAYVSDKGLMNGYTDGTFKPEEKITRAEYSAVVSRFKRLQSKETSFLDVKGHWASDYIGSLEKSKWIKGYPDGTFKPNANITRAEIATITNQMLDRKVDQYGSEDYPIKKFIDLEYGTWYYYDLIEATNTHEYHRRSEHESVEDWKANR